MIVQGFVREVLNRDKNHRITVHNKDFLPTQAQVHLLFTNEKLQTQTNMSIEKGILARNLFLWKEYEFDLKEKEK